MQDIEQKIIDIISYNLSINKEDVKLDSSIEFDLGADSLDMIELVLDIEWEYDITIYDEEIDLIRTVGQLIDVVKEKVEN